MLSHSHLTPNGPQASTQTPRRQSKWYVQAGSLFKTFWCALTVSLVLVGSMNAAAQTTAAVGFDPSQFRVAYTVPGGPTVGQVGEPVYKVEAPGVAGLQFNTSQTPFLLPCTLDRFG